MAIKEDVLEQIVEGYLLHKGYFVQHNVKFRPSKNHPDFISNQDSNHSDIDMVGYHPTEDGYKKVLAVSCKSWQGGFDPSVQLSAILDNKKLGGKDAWKLYHELTSPKWSEAFLKAIKDATGEDRFTYVTAVTFMKGDAAGKARWENHPPFKEALLGNPIQIITLREMINEILEKLPKTLAPTEVGRMLQLFRAAKIITATD